MTALVLPDSNILFSRTLRDWTFLLSRNTRQVIYTVHTTPDIIAETIAKIRDKNPLIGGQNIALIESRIRNSVSSVFSDYVPAQRDIVYDSMRDSGDYHVHAAASQGEISYLVTQDRGFLGLPEDVQTSLSYEIHSADSFFCLVDDSAPPHVEMIALEQLHYWRTKAETDDRFDADLPGALTRAGCPNFADRISNRLSHALAMPAPSNAYQQFAFDLSQLGR
jgi:predicted nucleic acid-binding protein